MFVINGCQVANHSVEIHRGPVRLESVEAIESQRDGRLEVEMERRLDQ